MTESQMLEAVNKRYPNSFIDQGLVHKELHIYVMQSKYRTVIEYDPTDTERMTEIVETYGGCDE